MDVVLQGFAGMVPSTFNSKIKDATVIDQSKWCGYQRPPIIYGAYCDSVAKYWYQSSENLYGKAAFYGGDAFHEGGIVPKDLNLSQYATNLQNWMLQTNKDAIWLLQAWQNNPKNGFLDGLKKENTMILDYSNDVYGFWKQRNGFDGFPWIFGVINNFGGRMGAYGRLQKVADEAYQLQSHPSKKNLKGVGIAPEAIVYNQVSYDIIWDLVWDTTQIQTADWICRFADKRYGVSSPRMHQAWQILNETAFSCSTRQEGGTESVINARPSLEINNVSCCSTSEIYYDPAELVKAWELMIESADELKNVNTFKFDLVDLTRQVLADYARKLYSEMISAYKSSNKELFAVKSKLFLELINDQDSLLSTREEFLLGKWISDARKLATNPSEADLFELNARALPTTWNTSEDGVLHEYAHHEWAGLTKYYYGERWKIFIDELSARLNGATPKEIKFYENFEKLWINKKGNGFKTKASSHETEISKHIYQKYIPVILK